MLEMLIAQACSGMVGMERDACAKAMEAVSVQYSIKQDVGSAEKATRDIVQKKVETVTGKEALAITLFTVKVVRDREVSANIVREKGKMPAVNTSVGEKNGKVTLSWSF